jgi:hypothetical protein
MFVFVGCLEKSVSRRRGELKKIDISFEIKARKKIFPLAYA